VDAAAGPVRVFLLCLDEVFRRGLASVLGDDPQLIVVGEAETAADGLVRVPAVRTDVAVLDLPLAGGAELCRRLRGGLPGLRFLLLSADDTAAAQAPVLGPGVSGHLRKPVRGRTLAAAVHVVAAGLPLTPAGLSGVIERRRSEPTGDRLAGLTVRERAVLRLIGEGMTNRQIADRMGLAEKTVKNYTSHLLAKLGLERRTQAAILATRLRGPPPRGWGRAGSGPGRSESRQAPRASRRAAVRETAGLSKVLPTAPTTTRSAPRAAPVRAASTAASSTAVCTWAELPVSATASPTRASRSARRSRLPSGASVTATATTVASRRAASRSAQVSAAYVAGVSSSTTSSHGCGRRSGTGAGCGAGATESRSGGSGGAGAGSGTSTEADTSRSTGVSRSGGVQPVGMRR
jgi:two-component system response regulator DevR